MTTASTSSREIPGEHVTVNARPRGYWRFSRAQRAEHLVQILSFTLLSVTGLPQKWPDSWWGDLMIRGMGGIEMTRLLHHAAAVTLIVATGYHIIIVGYKVFVKRTPLTMLPSFQDAKDAIQTLAYNIGRSPFPAKMGRYTFGEKVEYWALIWGTIVMILTGFVLWNPIIVTKFLPGEFVPAAKAAHGGEALLAVLSILTWHVYHVHIKHFNRSMFTGYLDPNVMEEEHPLELAGQTVMPPPDPAKTRRRAMVYGPMAVIMTVAMLIGIYFFLTYEETAITTVPRQEIEVYVPAEPTQTP
jgi:cytochrome b subunit of formate dehydrogenase